MDRTLATWLRWGTLIAFAVSLVGMAWMWIRCAGIKVADLPGLAACGGACPSLPGGWLVLTGAALLITVSAGRLLVLAVLWTRRGDWWMAAVAILALALVAAALVFRL